jgi:hypothetical protein
MVHLLGGVRRQFGNVDARYRSRMAERPRSRCHFGSRHQLAQAPAMLNAIRDRFQLARDNRARETPRPPVQGPRDGGEFPKTAGERSYVREIASILASMR